MMLNTQQFCYYFQLIKVSIGQCASALIQAILLVMVAILEIETSNKAAQYWAFRPIGDSIRWLYTPCVAINLTVWFALRKYLVMKPAQRASDMLAQHSDAKDHKEEQSVQRKYTEEDVPTYV